MLIDNNLLDELLIQHDKQYDKTDSTVFLFDLLKQELFESTSQLDSDGVKEGLGRDIIGDSARQHEGE